jgi:trk system potassium uptake protein
MKIIVAGGGPQAEFIVSMFKDKKNELVVINSSKEEAEIIMKRYRVPVYVGKPWRRRSLEEADAYDADAFISLCEKDTDNFASCLMAKNVFEAKKCICVVNNPKNVDLYKAMGIDSVISATYLLGQSVQSETSIASMLKTLSLENDKITMIEAVVLSKYRIANLALKDCRFPSYVSVACIYRTPDVIIPKGDTVILPRDNLLLVCAPTDQRKVMNFIRQEGQKPDLIFSKVAEKVKGKGKSSSK